MPLYLIVGGRTIDTNQTFDNLQDASKDEEWSLFYIWADKGKLYAQMMPPDAYRETLRTPGFGNCFY